LKRLWVALPDSLLAEDAGLEEKTLKVGQVGRACAIFRVERIYIYRDPEANYQRDGELIRLLLEYMDTPQYLRRRIFPKRPELALVGRLPPLRAPHHTVPAKLEEVREGDHRVGLVETVRGRAMVDVGLGRLIPLEGGGHEGQVVTVRIVGVAPELRARVVDRSAVPGYWGFAVKRVGSLAKLARSSSPGLFIATSRKGRPLPQLWDRLRAAVKEAGSVLVAFGSPKRGLYEILGDEGVELERLTSWVVNFFPGQGVKTVRSEEALLGVLAILNLAQKV
jgi:hypothetical protein